MRSPGTADVGPDGAVVVDGVCFAPVTDDAVPGLVALWEACGLTRPWNDPRTDVADALATPTSTVLVARDDGRTGGARGAAGDGSVVASVLAGHDGHRGWLYYVAVDPARQGSGLGRAAVVAGEAWLAAQGARKVRLMVRTGNDAVLGFYAGLGYTDTACTVLGRDLA